MSVCSISFVQSIIHVELQRKKKHENMVEIIDFDICKFNYTQYTVNVLSTVELACSTNPKRRSVRNKISVFFYIYSFTYTRSYWRSKFDVIDIYSNQFRYTTRFIQLPTLHSISIDFIL